MASGEAGATGQVTWSDSVSYKQTSYKTNLIDQTNKNVKWNVFFNGYNNQNWGIYTRDSIILYMETNFSCTLAHTYMNLMQKVI